MANDLGTLIADEVRRAEAEFEGVRSRALSLAALAGSLVTLLAGFIAIGAKDNPHLLDGAVRWVTGVALIAFVLSTLACLIVNLPQKATVSAPEDLRAYAENDWKDEGWDRQVAIYQGSYLISLRAANSRSACWLMGALALEVVGVAATALAAGLVLHNL